MSTAADDSAADSATVDLEDVGDATLDAMQESELIDAVEDAFEEASDNDDESDVDVVVVADVVDVVVDVVVPTVAGSVDKEAEEDDEDDNDGEESDDGKTCTVSLASRSRDECCLAFWICSAVHL